MALPLYDTVLTAEYLQREYVEKGRGSTDIGRDVGANPATVRNYLIRYQIARRCGGTSPARMYPAVDASGFIAPASEGHAYWIGFLAADGSVQGRNQRLLRLKLAMIDTAHVEAWRQFVGVAAPVRPSGTDAAYVDVTSAPLVDALARWGIVPNKTLTMPFPIHMPGALLPAYIRGYFDGDGSIMWRDRTSPTSHWREVTIRFTSGSLSFLAGLQSVLNTAGIATNKPYSNGGYTYVLPVAGRNDNARRFAAYLYAGATTYLERKHRAFLPLLSEAV